ncbi:MAG: LexA family transcriptional regulator [Clostridia bacterium]|nr:LexA family transcriptional regulator [Clostridia bacterium]
MASQNYELYSYEKAKARNMVGDKILQQRKAHDLNQADLVKRLEKYGVKVQVAAVSKWEKGDTAPNIYQLIAICLALDIRDGLSYFMPSGEGYLHERLNTDGLKALGLYRKFLEGQNEYLRKSEIEMVEMPVSTQSASAGFGEILGDEQFIRKSFPVSSVPTGADFAVPVSGDSMEPLLHDGQLAWIQKTTELKTGEIGLFIVDGDGYIKLFEERIPEGRIAERFKQTNEGMIYQVVLTSTNKRYAPLIVMPDSQFRIVGRVLRTD